MGDRRVTKLLRSPAQSTGQSITAWFPAFRRRLLRPCLGVPLPVLRRTSVLGRRYARTNVPAMSCLGWSSVPQKWKWTISCICPAGCTRAIPIMCPIWSRTSGRRLTRRRMPRWSFRTYRLSWPTTRRARPWGALPASSTTGRHHQPPCQREVAHAQRPLRFHRV